jgi:hypothetical protein
VASEDYLQWEYQANPDGQAIIEVAEKNGVVVSQYAVLPRRFSCNENIISGSLSVNTVTAPPVRGLNLFSQLAERTFQQCTGKNIVFTIGFPNPVSLPVIRKKKIFSVMGTLPVLIMPVNIARSLTDYISGNKEKSGSEIELKVNEESAPGVELFDFDSDANDYELLCSAFEKTKNITTHRSLEFLKWRYSDIPLRKYYILKSTIQGRIASMIILRSKMVFGVRCLIIVDIISVDGSSLKMLLGKVKTLARKNRIGFVVAAVSLSSGEYGTLRRTGFFHMPGWLLPQKAAVIIRTHADCNECDVTCFDKWFLTFGDYDIF